MAAQGIRSGSSCDRTATDRAGATANYIKSFVHALPPLHEVSKMAGIELPEYLGKMGEKDKGEAGCGAGGTEKAAATMPPKT